MKTKEKSEAIKLRKAGKSVREIERLLKVSRSSVSLWVRDVNITAEQKVLLNLRRINNSGQKKGSEAHRKKSLKLREGYQQEGREDAKKKSSLHMKMCMLYWAEGSKSRNATRMSNTDPYILKLFVKGLLEFFGVKKDKIELRIRGYSDNGVSKKNVSNFWSKTFGLSKKNVRQVKFDCDKRIRKGKRNNIHIYGICEVNVSDTRLVQRIFGAIQEYAEFNNPDWVL